MSFIVKTFKWVDEELTVADQSFDTLDLVWEFIDTADGKAAEGVRVFSAEDCEIFSLNPEVQFSSIHANDYEIAD